MKQIFLGIDQQGEKVVDSIETQKQIKDIKQMECAVLSNGNKLDWGSFDEPSEPGSLFQFILNDRKIMKKIGNFLLRKA